MVVSTRRLGSFGLAVAALGVVAFTLGQAIANDMGRASEHLAVLDRPQADADRIPELLANKIPRDLHAETARFVADDSGRRSWAAVDTSGQVCLVTVLPGPSLVTGVTCVPPAEFAKRGLGLQVVGDGTGSEGYLVPDGYVVEGAQADERYWVSTAPNWFVSSVHAPSVEPLRLVGPEGAELVLEDLGPPPD